MLITESFADYRLLASSHLTSHALADFRRCPLGYRQKRQGIICDIDRPSYKIGRAAHTRILEGEAKYTAEYAIGGPVNEKTGRPYGAETNAYGEWSAAQGRPCLTLEQADLIRQYADGILRNTLATNLLADGAPEQTARVGYCGIACQARIDWAHPALGVIDLKTCENLDNFEHDARRYKYIHQMAFYAAILNIAEKRLGGSARIIAVEKSPPYRCGVWEIAQTALDAARKENELAIDALKRCVDSDTWPTGYEDMRILY